LYGCETWSLTLREEHRLRAFANTILRRISESKRDEVTREWSMLHNAELLHTRLVRLEEESNVYKVLVGKPEGKRPLERPRCRWENGIRMDLREIGWGSVEWIQLA
jgi:hypothetical protein